VLEILDDLDVLARPDVDVRTLGLAGVGFGSRAAETVPRDRIVQAISPAVRLTLGSSDRSGRFYREDGRELSFAAVVDTILDGAGTLHFADHTCYRIADGRVVGFALSGDVRGHLRHFAHLRSYDEFLFVFGMPDRAEQRIDTGEVMGYVHHYWASRKRAYWDAWEDHLTLVNLGDFE
jgi:hypothetical protein